MPRIGGRNPMRRGWPRWRRSGASIIAGGTVLNPDFKEFIALLNANDVHYLVVGGYAVALHGYPRYTKDLDIWIERSAENADRIVKALQEFGFGSLGLKADDFLVTDQIIQLGYPPRRIDLLTALPGVEFDECLAKRLVIKMEGVEVNFIGLEDLKQNKRASGRYQDLADLENLEAAG
jgi:predicted nucleotidyltransferase